MNFLASIRMWRSVLAASLAAGVLLGISGIFCPAASAFAALPAVDVVTALRIPARPPGDRRAAAAAELAVGGQGRRGPRAAANGLPGTRRQQPDRMAEDDGDLWDSGRSGLE